MTAVDVPSRTASRPMNPWRLEWLRLRRSPRGISLLAVYLAAGVLGPVVAAYLPTLVKNAENGMTIIVPPPVPRDGIVDFVNQAGQSGLVVAVVVAAGALAVDARRGISTFLRTRIASLRALVLPRFTVVAAAVVLAYAAGTAVACYETALLLGGPPAGPVLAGLLCQGVYLVFAVAVVAAAASVTRGVLGTVGLALAVLLVLPLPGALDAVHAWLPSSLALAPVELLKGQTLADQVPALVVTAAAVPLLLTLAVSRLGARETG